MILWNNRISSARMWAPWEPGLCLPRLLLYSQWLEFCLAYSRPSICIYFTDPQYLYEEKVTEWLNESPVTRQSPLLHSADNTFCLEHLCKWRKVFFSEAERAGMGFRAQTEKPSGAVLVRLPACSCAVCQLHASLSDRGILLCVCFF